MISVVVAFAQSIVARVFVMGSCIKKPSRPILKSPTSKEDCSSQRQQNKRHRSSVVNKNVHVQQTLPNQLVCDDSLSCSSEESTTSAVSGVQSKSRRPPIKPAFGGETSTSETEELCKFATTGLCSPNQSPLVSNGSDAAVILLTECEIPILLEVLTEYAYKWREIGLQLRFSSNELKTIATKPSLFENAPNSYLSEMLTRWVQWSPQTHCGKPATLDELIHALRSKTVGLAAVAEELKKSISGVANQMACLSQSTQQESHDAGIVTRNVNSFASPLEHYAFYLRSYFTCNREPADKWPEIEAKEYIRLAVVSNEFIGRVELEEFREATIHGSIDDILKSKAPLEFNDILKPIRVKGREYPVRRILLEGAPGIGKSTMSWEVCQKWGNGELFQEYFLVIMLRFRDSWVQKVKSLSDMFRFSSEPQMQQEISKQIRQTLGKDVLFILEGFDEAPPSLRSEDSLFFELFKGSLLPYATVMVTTRPSASYDLQRCCKSTKYSRRIEVLGFGKKEIDEYIEAHFSQSTLPVEDFYKYLELYPHIYSMMYVPLNSAIVTHVYQMCKSASTLVPQTMTQLYTSLVKTLLLRYLKDREEYEDVQINSFSDLPEPVFLKFLQICQIAFDGFTKCEKEIIFSGLPKDFDSLGLMQSVSELYIDKGASVSHNFLHLTIQEFLGAFYLTMRNEDEQINFLDQNIYGKEGDKKSYQTEMARFFTGLCENNPTPVCEVIKNKRVYSHHDKRNWIINKIEVHLLFELHTPNVLASIFESQNPMFGYELHEYKSDSLYWDDSCVDDDLLPIDQLISFTPYDFYMLSYVIVASDCKWKVGLSHDSILTDAIFENLLSTDQGSESGPSAHIAELECSLYSSKITKLVDLLPNLNHFCIGYLGFTVGKLSACLPNPQLSLTVHKLYVSNEKELAAVGNLLASPHHTFKHIAIQHLGSDSVQLTIDYITNPQCSVQEFSIRNSVVNPLNIASLAKLLEVSTTLTALSIRSNLETHAIACLAKAMEKNTMIKVLCVHNDLEVDSQESKVEFDLPRAEKVQKSEFLSSSALCHMLVKNKSLIQLNVKHCQLSGQHLTLLAEVLKNNSTLKYLNLNHNMAGNDGAAALATALRSNTTLSYLHLKHNSIGNEGFTSLLEALSSNSTLQYLCLKDNPVGDKDELVAMSSLLTSTLKVDTIWTMLSSLYTKTGIEIDVDYVPKEHILEIL